MMYKPEAFVVVPVGLHLLLSGTKKELVCIDDMP